MEKEKNILDRLAGQRPFKVPQGYFDGLSDQIMSSLPADAHHVEPITVTPWMRIKPYIYMAAAFAGLFFGIDLFVCGDKSQHTAGSQMASEQEVTIYSDEYIDSFLDESMVSDYMLFDLLVEN